MLIKRAFLLLSLWVVVCGSMTLADERSSAAPTRAAGPGWFVPAPDGRTTAERFELDPGVVSRLAATALEDSVWFADWPIAPGARATVRLTRHDVYAPDARVFVVDSGAATPAPRSRLAFFWGEADDATGARVLAIADPDRGTLRSFVEGEEGWNELRPDPGTSGEYLLAPVQALLGDDADKLTRDCAHEPLFAPVTRRPIAALPATPTAPPNPSAAIAAALRKVTLAIDTDNELLLQKFANDTTAATNYVAGLVALISAVYERDLSLRVLQGTTHLRPSTTSDPWAQGGTGNADSAKINELRAYWAANYSSVARGATLLLSGKQANAYSSSGIGYVNALCDKTYGYAIVQVFKFSGSTPSTDLMVSAHELGHVVGSRHSHCYVSPTPIDACYSGESGCYAGTTSCPAAQTINGVANVRGTLMSYCHMLSGCSTSTVFHPRTADVLNPILTAKTGVCVSPLGTPKEASPSGNLAAIRAASGSGVSVTFAPACGASGHTVYAGNLTTLASGGVNWTQRYCGFGATGTATFNPGGGSTYFVVVANNGSVEGSYGRSKAGVERVAAGAGGACSYTQQLSGSCP